MSNLTTHEDEIVLVNTLNQYWSKVARKFHHNETTLNEDESSLSFSWQAFIDDENLNVFNSSFECDDVIPIEPNFKKDEKLFGIHEIGDEFERVEIELGDLSCDKTERVRVADGSSIGDVPILYTVEGLLPQELPVKGTFIHPRITPGFSYIVRPLDSSAPLFDGKAVCLQRIGMGYGKRLTFTGDSLHENENFFWSDTNPEGYGFTLELVHAGDKFRVLDANKNPVALLVVSHVMGHQKETNQSSNSTNHLRKEAAVKLRCKVSYFDQSPNKPCNDVIAVGIAVASKKPKSSVPASVVKVKDCFINGEKYTLVPQTTAPIERSKQVGGQDCADVPLSYDISGLRPNELPIIGTYVDPDITPGFKYKVREVDSKRYLFDGKALTLLSIGRGYGKRLTFAAESLKENQNYFWSDTNPSGYGLALEAVSEGESFRILNSFGDEIGNCLVFRLCGPQTYLDSSSRHKTHSKRVLVSLACHLELFGRPDQITTKVEGIATVTRSGSTGTKIHHLMFPYLFDSQDIMGEVISFVKA